MRATHPTTHYNYLYSTAMSSLSKHIKAITLTLSVLISFAAQAQVTRMAVVNHRNQVTYINVYECDYVDEQPQFPGGERALMNFINATREYPYRAYHAGVQGRVVCSFVVNTNGSISHVQVLKGVEESVNREAVRVISAMPRWRVGRMSGQAVPVRCVLPIAFRL